MPNYTNIYNFIKPKKTENYDIDDVTNKNMDSIDSILNNKVDKIPGKSLSENDFSDGYKKKIDQMVNSKKGNTFTPSVDSEGNLSWTNDGDLENPETVNIRGPQGVQGPQGETGNGITRFFQYASDVIEGRVNNKYKLVFDNGNFENITVIDGKDGEQGPQGVQGVQGIQGEPGATGPANTLVIGTVTSGNTASAEITGNAPNQTLNLVLPQGPQGPQGEPGPTPDLSDYYNKTEINTMIGDIETLLASI